VQVMKVVNKSVAPAFSSHKKNAPLHTGRSYLSVSAGLWRWVGL
jgi:hypothetical protein